MSDLLHAPTALSPASNKYDALEEKNLFCPCWKSNLDSSVFQPKA
jgi:hypothetical protein